MNKPVNFATAFSILFAILILAAGIIWYGFMPGRSSSPIAPVTAPSTNSSIVGTTTAINNISKSLPTQNGQTALVSGADFTFSPPVLYPSSWKGDCQFTQAQGVGDTADLYCEVMNQPFDFIDLSSTPNNFCAVKLDNHNQQSVQKYNNYTDPTEKAACNQELTTIGKEYLSNIATFNDQYTM